ncbi:MAG: hypothetical protein WCJ87_11710, partial [Burkholderiales bacterium]
MKRSDAITSVSTLNTGPEWHWRNGFHALGAEFHTELPPQPLPAPHWVACSDSCAELLGLPADWPRSADLNALAVFSGNALWPGMRPLA